MDMSDAELALEELKLSEVQEAEKDAGKLLEKLEGLRSTRHLSIAIAGMENVIYRLRDERRHVAGRIASAKQAPSHYFD